jgi:uncharacterized protein (DUF2267 family)
MVEARQTENRDESANDLLGDIRRRVRLPAGVSAEDAVKAVMCTVSQHVAASDAREIFQGLPKPLRSFVVRCLEHQTARVGRFDREELVQRVAEHLHASRGDAEDIASAVITALSARLPGGKAAEVASRLPASLQSLWVPRRVALPSEPHPIIGWIEASVTLPDGVDGVAAFAATMGLLTRRLTRGEGRHLVESLPVDLAPLVQDYLADRGEPPADFDPEEYLNLVAQELNTDDVDEAESVARAVFAAVQEYLRSDVYEHVLRQVPLRLQELWAV